MCAHERKRSESGTAEPVPVTELSAFGSPNATPTVWSQAQDELAVAEVYWLSTVRPDGRPHVTPLLGIWLEGALYFCTDRTSEKRRTSQPTVIGSLGQGKKKRYLVIEGTAESVSDHAELGPERRLWELPGKPPLAIQSTRTCRRINRYRKMSQHRGLRPRSPRSRQGVVPSDRAGRDWQESRAGTRRSGTARSLGTVPARHATVP